MAGSLFGEQVNEGGDTGDDDKKEWPPCREQTAFQKIFLPMQQWASRATGLMLGVGGQVSGGGGIGAGFLLGRSGQMVTTPSGAAYETIQDTAIGDVRTMTPGGLVAGAGVSAGVQLSINFKAPSSGAGISYSGQVGPVNFELTGEGISLSLGIGIGGHVKALAVTQSYVEKKCS